MILVNGCSHTAGTEAAMDYRLDLTYPNILSRKLKQNVQNLSSRGASNDRIFRTTSCAVPIDNPKHAVIQWTFPNRFETPKGDQMLPTAQEMKLQRGWEFVSQFYNYNDRETAEGLDSKTIVQMWHTQNMFELYDIDYTFIVWRPILYKTKLWSLIDQSKFLNIGDMDTMLHENGFKLSTRAYKDHPNQRDKHYQQDAHAFIAESVIEHMQTGKQLIAEDSQHHPDVGHYYG